VRWLAARAGTTARAPGRRTVIAAALVAVAGVAACSARSGPPGGPAAGRPAASASAVAPAAQPGATISGLQVITAPSRVRAKGAAIADALTRQLLWSRGIDTELPIGSVTKVMTALVVLRAGNLDQQIRIPKSVLHYVARYQAESAGLHPGDVLTVRQLLAAMLLPSGCDAAYVLALTYGPGMPAFLAKMNATALQLGMTQTHFTSPDGLPYPTEYSTYSTPRDLITLGLAAMQSPAFRAIVSLRFYHLPKGKRHHSYWWDNTNDLIGNYRGAEGIKTGYTDAAKHCLLFEAERNGRTLIGVVLGSPVTGPEAGAQAAARLLDWGFGLKPVPAAQAAAG
jgi:serine-type D-Ala-D-Ala carboxypeptidase (penicillin-binding protein 5/6)